VGRYRITRHIDAPPDRVYRTFTDPALVADWMDASAVVNPTGPLDLPGSQYTLVIWRPWRFRTEVVRAESPRLHETFGRGPLGTVVRMVATLTARDGGTDLDLLTEYAMPFGAVGRWIDRRWIDREPHPTANREVDRLVTLASEPGTPLRHRGTAVGRDGRPLGPDVTPEQTVIRMSVLTRVSSPLLLLGGALMTLLLVVITIAPATPALYGFLVVAPVIGVGALGAMLAPGIAAGRLGRVSGWFAALGGVAVVGVGLFAIATDQFSATAGVGDDDPLAIPFAITSIGWMLGSLGVALAMTSGRSIPALGGWLVLAGTASAIVLGTLLGAIAPELSALSALPFAIGWVVVGWDSRRHV
jgi:hypothetical protein